MKSDEGLHQRLGERLRRARTSVGLSQEEAGWRAGLHRTEIGLLERGERMPRVDTLLRICVALEVSPSEVLQGVLPENL